MIEINSFSKNYSVIFMMLALWAVFNIYPMKNNCLALDNLLLGEPYDWKVYLQNHSLKNIFTFINKFKIDKNLTDVHGNNLMLAFVDYDHGCYEKECNSRCIFPSKYEKDPSLQKKKLTSKKLQQFFDQNFDINFQNTKTKNTLLLHLLDSHIFRQGYIPSDLITWLIHTHKPNLNLQNDESATALSRARDYELIAMLLKYGASLSMTYKNGIQLIYFAETKKVAQLLKMFCDYCSLSYTGSKEITTFCDFWNKYYDFMHSKKFQELENLITSSGESVTIFNHAAISNKSQVLDIFLKVPQNQQKTILLKIVEHCCTWNRAGATEYALSKLNPNRALIVEYFQKNYIQQKIDYYYVPKLERELINIYKYAYNEPKTGFKAWLFLEAFDHYLTYGPKKEFDVSVFMNYKKDYDITFNLKKRSGFE